MDYSERLHVPLRWWVQGTMLVASFWLALVVSIPETAAWSITAVTLVVMAALFLAYGARVRVSDGTLHAGKAHIALSYVGDVEPLGTDATKLTAGRDADARAFLLLRPYLKRSVKVHLTDPADPTPYWLIHTRHPRELAAAITGAAASAQRGTPAR
ncbi:DUF3093 domain-containing protein [Nocardioides daphniae]|uniref:DUF3093 domain-containing protein n=1 Tax=Nocardioides daphniae TaxID=402297 RepID=A0ABQ1QB36_9ACTN|nr:DUF3093 domain-containing protein [Nocardioides daphniae]GGD19530.1 hypothetical protein GCM10007231_18370 [Nocardioides daphniae]